jgi:hypothetical protein
MQFNTHEMGSMPLEMNVVTNLSLLQWLFYPFKLLWTAAYRDQSCMGTGPRRGVVAAMR